MTTAKAPPAPDGLPVLGHALAFSRNPLAFLERAASEHGDVVALSMRGHSGVLVAHPDEIERVLVSDADTYPKGDFQRSELSGLPGDGSLIADGDTWRRRREALQPAFFARRIEAAEPTMRQATRRVAADWTAGDTTDVHDTATTLTLSVLADAFFDVDAGGRDSSADPSFAGAHEDVAGDADRPSSRTFRSAAGSASASAGGSRSRSSASRSPNSSRTTASRPPTRRISTCRRG